MENAYEKVNLAITAWAEEDRPREKMMAKGRTHLSDAELLAILLGSGSRELSAVGLAQQILQFAQNNLNQLGKYSINDFIKNFHGVGPAKAITIIAALELGRRRQLSDVVERPQIRSSRDAYNVLAPMLTDLPHEEFWILNLSRSNKVLNSQRISEGGVAGTVVDAKKVFRKALDHNASSIILFHNHPSGNLSPSQADIDVTRKLKKAGEFIEITVFDHIIIGEMGKYFSFADESMM